MNQRLELKEEGKLFIWAMKTCLKWLAIGGDIEVTSGHRIMMTEEGEPGFWAVRESKGRAQEEILMLIDSDTAWMYLVRHAREMKEKEIVAMCANLGLNDIAR